MIEPSEKPIYLEDLIKVLQFMLSLHGNIACFTFHPDWKHTTVEGKIEHLKSEVDIKRFGDKILVL